jgi:protein-S-isoprenylcysteine O-methyltransferase Ste14
MYIKKIMPTTLLLVAILAMVLLHYVFPLYQLVPAPYNLLGILPLGFGVVINLIADKKFHQANTTVKPFQESSALVTDGVFKMCRNPMYSGFLFILVGVAILLGSLSPFVIVVAYFFVIDRVFVRVEESMLAQRFGIAYEDYKKTTRRWL